MNSPTLHQTSFDLSFISDRFASWRLILSELPGCQRTGYSRNLDQDLDEIHKAGCTDVLILLERSELRRYRVELLQDAYSSLTISSQLYEIVDGFPPSIAQTFTILQSLVSLFHNDKSVLIHCQGGLGRTGTVVACLIMLLSDGSIAPDRAIEIVRSNRGKRAIQTASQFKFLHNFPSLLPELRQQVDI
ncbi:hypothetical protein GEMRC1_003742 [Eukaryota sp. GEM-RC1]